MTIKFGSPEAQAIIEADRELLYERRTEIQATMQCKCGAEIELVAETEEWDIDEETGEHKHSEFGPAMGYCEKCDNLFVDSWDGTFVYHKSKSKRKS